MLQFRDCSSEGLYRMSDRSYQVGESRLSREFYNASLRNCLKESIQWVSCVVFVMTWEWWAQQSLLNQNGDKPLSEPKVCAPEFPAIMTMNFTFDVTFPIGVSNIRAPGLVATWSELKPARRFNIKMTSYQYRKSHCGDINIRNW